MISLIDLTFRYIKKQSRRSILALSGIALSVALITSLGIIGESIRFTMIEQAKNSGGFYHVYYKKLNLNQIEVLENHNKVAKVGASTPLGSYNLPDKSVSIDIEGYNSNARQIFDLSLLSGRFPISNNEIVLEEWILKEMNLKSTLGQKIHLSFNSSDTDENSNFNTYNGESDFILVGILKNLPSSKAVGMSFGCVTQDTVKSMLPDNFFYYNAFVRIKEGFPFRKAIKEIQKDVGMEDKNVISNDTLLNVLGEAEKPNYPLIFLDFIVVIVAGSVIYNVFNISVLERVRQFGMLRAIGATQGQVRKIVLGEAFLLSILSIPFGLLMGVFIAKVLSHLVSSIISGGLSGIVISFKILLGATLVGLVSVFISVLSPAFLAGKTSPLEAILSNTKVIKESNSRQKRWYSIIQSKFGIIGKMAYQNLWRNRKRSYITIFSMCLGIILFTVFSFFVANVNTSSKLNDLVYGDNLIIVENQKQNHVGYSENDLQEISNIPGVNGVLKTQYSSQIVTTCSEDKITPELKQVATGIYKQEKDPQAGTYNIPSELFGYNEETLKIINKHLIAGEINLESMPKGPIALIAESIPGLDMKTGLKIGDEITIRKMYKEGNKIKYGDSQKIKIGGIVRDILFSGKKSTLGLRIIVHENIYKNVTGYNDYQRFDIKTNQGSDKQLIQTKLRKIAQTIPQGTFISYDEEFNKNEDDRRNMILLFYSLIAVIMLISIFNIVNTINANLILRVREFGTLRAIGITNKQLRYMTLMEGFFYGLIAVLWGSVFGIALAYILYLLIKGQMTYLSSWTLPWQAVILSWIGSVLIGVLSTFAPLKRMTSINIIDSIRSIE